MTRIKASSNKKAIQQFTKKQLMNSQKYLHRHDALQALLDANTMYSYEQVETILKQFDKGGK